MNRALKLVLTPTLIAFVLGFLVSLATGFTISPEKAATLPGGSLASGLQVGFVWCLYNPRVSKLIILTSALAGVLGYLTYSLMFVP